jgi:hypothetical protein
LSFASCFRVALGAEEGDEVEVLVGSYIRQALIENISKSVDRVGVVKLN